MIRPAYGPLSFAYKSALNAWTTGITLQDTTGNVGIGTTSPSYKLNVVGTAGFSSTINAPSIGTGTDDSVVVLNSSGNLVTDEIDTRVWGTTLVDGSGATNYVTYWSDANTLTGEQYLATARGGWN